MTTELHSSFFEFFEFWIWTNHNSLLSIATNQFASFFADIRSLQCYFRVCQSGEIRNKRAFFPCILIFFLYKTNRFHVAVRLFSNRSQRTSNVIRTSVTHSGAPRLLRSRLSGCHATLPRKERLLTFEPHPFPDLSQSQLQFYFLELSRAKFSKDDSTNNRELKHARFWDADGNRKRTFHMPGQWCLPDFCTNHLWWRKDT